ncbi:unnamed protein product [Caenorhabditis bovis]|uniref:ATP-dependent RNA helicase n=1 Tax=Caenorhabditis bovis TaxID=2654633 RepID=A0A8S1F5Q4_9PELO|nr:unnamed protein product [Caenorhabditis bovis]
MPHTNNKQGKRKQKFKQKSRYAENYDFKSLKVLKERRNAKKRKQSLKEKEGEMLENIEENYKELMKKSTQTFLTFDDFPLSWRTLEGLKENDYKKPTDIQRETLSHALNGSDVVGAAKTGSGKTLAFVIPVLEALWRAKWSSTYGLGALVISPTRELALQIFGTINAVGKHHEFSCGLLIGGNDVSFEKNRIAGVNIIVCTPGRLLQHMDENEQMQCDQLQILVLDEADRMLDMGFARQLNSIVLNLPKNRQTLLFSATQTRNVKDLCRVCTQNPVYVSVHENSMTSTPENLKQMYALIDEHEKLNNLWSFIETFRKKKILVFVATCKQARFITEAFCALRPGVPVMGLWGTMNQTKRIESFTRFDESKAAVMIATDVASRGLDFENVEWVVQFDCPAEIEDYIHRVGRSARMEEKGNSLLFITPRQHDEMISLLQKSNIPIEESRIDPNSIKDIRVQLRALLAESSDLKKNAQKSVVAYLRSVHSMRNKKLFHLSAINLKDYSDSYGLIAAPRVRFLEKDAKRSKQKEAKNEEDENEDSAGLFSINENDDYLFAKASPSKKTPNGDDDDIAKETASTTKKALTKKLVTKVSMAKKILNKKIKVNSKKVFDDDEDGGEKSTMLSEGLDIQKAKEDMKNVDKEDRKRFRELRAKRREEKLAKKRRKMQTDDVEMDCGDDGDEPDLSWLPDPDKFKDDSDCDEDDNNTDSLEQNVLNMLEQMAQSYLPVEKFLSRKQETLNLHDDVIYWKRMQQLTVFQEPSVVSSVRISPVKPFNVASTSSVRLTLYDTSICEPLNLFSRFKKAVSSIDFRHDGRLIAIGGDEGKLRVFDIEKNTSSKVIALRVMQASQSTVKSVHFSTSGEFVYSMADDGFVKQYRVADTNYGVNAVPTIEFRAHDDSIRCGAVSKLNDHIVVTGGYDHKVRVWDIRSKQNVAELDCEYPVESVLFMPGEQLISTAAGPVVKVWDLTGGGRQIAALQAHYKTVTALRLATNSTCLLTAGIDKRINVFKTTNYSLLHSWSMPAPVLDFDISKDDKTMAIGMGNLLAIYKRADIKKEVTATAVHEKKRSLIRTSAPPTKLVELNQKSRKTEAVAKSADKVKLNRIDALFAGYKHSAVIRQLFNGKFQSSIDASVVSYLRAIILRDAIHRAIAGQDLVVQKNLLRFLSHNLFKSQYFPVLKIVAEAYFEVYSNEVERGRLFEQVKFLRTAIARELEVQKMICSLIGSVEVILTTSKANNDSSNDLLSGDDIFGEPIVIDNGFEEKATNNL